MNRRKQQWPRAARLTRVEAGWAPENSPFQHKRDGERGMHAQFLAGRRRILQGRPYVHRKRQQKNTIGCQKIEGTYQELIEAFQEVYDVSIYDAFTELTNIRMREGESIVVFANR